MKVPVYQYKAAQVSTLRIDLETRLNDYGVRGYRVTSCTHFKRGEYEVILEHVVEIEQA